MNHRASIIKDLCISLSDDKNPISRLKQLSAQAKINFKFYYHAYQNTVLCTLEIFWKKDNGNGWKTFPIDKTSIFVPTPDIYEAKKYVADVALRKLGFTSEYDIYSVRTNAHDKREKQVVQPPTKELMTAMLKTTIIEMTEKQENLNDDLKEICQNLDTYQTTRKSWADIV